MQTNDAGIPEVAIIGRDDGRTFHDLLQKLRQNAHLHVNAEYLTLSEALQAGLGQTVQADFVIVLQSWSDEFAQHEINELIGRLLFGRILCCYGPWCTADGRSHELWPVTFRVPAASAAAVVDLELAGFLEKTQPLFPMSAGEEVFVHRSQIPDMIEPGIRRKAVIVSDDPQLRKTVAGILAALKFETTALPLRVEAIRGHFASGENDPALAIIDLDGPTADIQAGLDALHSEARLTTVVGMSVFAASLSTAKAPSKTQPSHVIEKTELLLELRGLMTGFPTGHSMAWT